VSLNTDYGTSNEEAKARFGLLCQRKKGMLSFRQNPTVSFCKQIHMRLDVQRHVSDLQIHLHAVGRFTNCGQVAVCYHLFHYRGVHTQYEFASLV
jgi:hypothetical protein